MPENEKIKQLVDHLFRHESGKLVSVLTRIFGADNLDLAEDVVQDSLVEAISQWTYKGVPENPSGWLFMVARNKALNIINREKYKRKYSSDVAHFLQSQWTAEPALNHIFSEQQILDDQLRMMFTCCHPSISADSQVALTLKTLCGFSIAEIAKAFLTTDENVNKRLVRARQKIREDKIPFEVPEGKMLETRLDAVLESIYLLFNEGYSASTGNDVIRFELCEEAIRLSEIMAAHDVLKNRSGVHAVLSLMYLNASRFKSRTDDNGNILTMAEQDRSLWDRSLMQKGFYFLEKSASHGSLSIYHILAAISAYHCAAKDFESTDWNSILSLYDKLIKIDPSPVVLLNRAIVISKVRSASEALEELEKIKDSPAFESYHLFYSTRAELYIQINEFRKAAESLKKAIQLSPLQVEKDLLQKKLDLCVKK
ncbi:MAG: sigma-70 family RNA polymerase sigma factor [Cyclobacteriaceae bacterium]